MPLGHLPGDRRRGERGGTGTQTGAQGEDLGEPGAALGPLRGALRHGVQGPGPLPGRRSEDEGAALARTGGQGTVIPDPQGDGAPRGEEKDVDAVQEGADDGEEGTRSDLGDPDRQDAIERAPALRRRRTSRESPADGRPRPGARSSNR